MKNNRLFKILYYILEKGKVTANELAEKYEVSIRTIYRDIDVLSSAGIPIYTIQGKGGGIEILDDFVLKKSFLSKNEQEQILIALKSLELINEEYENELLTKLSALFKKKNTDWIEVDFTNWQGTKSYDELFKNIKSSIINKTIVRFKYFSSDKKETIREVKPIKLLFKDWDWYMYAFCLLRNDFRYFKLSRIKEFEILSNNFEDDFNDIVLKKEAVYEETIFVKIKFDKKVAFRVYDEISSIVEEDEDGNLYATIELPNNYNLYNYIFSYGNLAEVLEPKEIREKIKDIINLMIKKYII